MRAIIMCGGKGTRIAAMEASVPKPMIRLCGKPVLEHQLEWLKRQGIEEAVLVTGHLGHVIRDYFGDGSGILADSGEASGTLRRASRLGRQAPFIISERIKRRIFC